MITFASLAASAGARCERRSENFHGTVTPLLGAHPVPGVPWGSDAGPQAYLVQQDPGWSLATHYHTEHQFQLVSRGRGTLGQHALEPLMLHYASPESGYGPLVAGEHGLEYYTLRARGTRDTWYLPQARERLRRGLKKRHAYGGPVHSSMPDERAGRRARAVQRFMDGADGLGAWMLRLPPGDVVDREEEPCGGVRFYYVAAGSLSWRGECAQAGDVFSVDQADEHLDAQAGDSGAELIVMRFPDDCLT
ncbi:hypothetical protein EZ313_16775 [Ramlibacter henchirensis]|uniref:Cupin domain-containing protein n=1 Tax=Ramlibacter henchirensis TaxID=204072 RepID=A0A4Z0BX87_9BURK|nr:hypothetical protein [Ramlibacter henchirensis]TFZ02888.1 hypothetical protein EZ313_16775 [Ramlibacter henchirensis]